MTENLLKRFLKYVRIDTQSDEASTASPSTPKQMDFARLLRDELLALGVADARVSEWGVVYASQPATAEGVPPIGFIAHMDTSPDLTGAGVKPRIVERYDGGDIGLDPAGGIVLSPREFPELLRHRGEDLVVTDGHTLLGADDKAGVAEIMTLAEYLVQHPEVRHGRVCIAFTPDEEVGRGVEHFDVQGFGAEWAYTVDGGEVGELEYENFNAAAVRVEVSGRNVHPGAAKGKMLNSQYLAMRFAAAVPEDERPETTEGREGFYHLTGIAGSVEQTVLTYILRDHDRARFEQRKKYLAETAARLNAEAGGERIRVAAEDQYYNMRERIEPCMHIVDIAAEAMRQVGVEPRLTPVRGGTDGAMLSFKGLPCPNLFAGGLNFHGRYEFVPVRSMELALQTLIKIVELTAQKR